MVRGGVGDGKRGEVMGVDTYCPNCNARLYLGTEFERTTCDRCPCVSWLVVEWELPKEEDDG